MRPYHRIDAIVIEGFKSLRDRTEIEFRPLTLLSGPNSAGKSSAMQPLLLLKQTLEVSYDPGAILLSGPNVRFTDMDQLLWKGKRREDRASGFTVGFRRHDQTTTLRFESGEKELDLTGVTVTERSDPMKGFDLRPGMTQAQILRLPPFREERGPGAIFSSDEFESRYRVVRDRCSFGVTVSFKPKGSEGEYLAGYAYSPFDQFGPLVEGMLHLPGLRGNPVRSYPKTQVGGPFPGVFQDYTASVIASWKGDPERLTEVGRDLERLGLTWKVEARPVDQTRVELRVGRMPRPQQGGARDLVNIVDVGFGVTQVLPVVVALRVAEPGQIVYLEQPEIHLHPRAQVTLGELLLAAAARGIYIIAETHSSLIIRSIQEGVASGRAKPSLVKLHWFARDAQTGATVLSSADLDERGTFGEWPLDFGRVELDLEDRFLDASLRIPTK
jgi:predicted ATPase